MHDGLRPNNGAMVRSRQPARTAGFVARPKRWTSNAPRRDPKHVHNLEKNYERYMALARAESLNGNTVGAENYYQHAEHYYREMSSDPEAR
jgi:hypothetical protein